MHESWDTVTTKLSAFIALQITVKIQLDFDKCTKSIDSTVPIFDL